MDYMETIRTYWKKPNKKIQKCGTIAIDVVETTPVVWKDKLFLFEWQRNFNDENRDPSCTRGYFHFIDFETNTPTPLFAHGFTFGSAYTENDKMYVIGTQGWGGNRLTLFSSSDLSQWKAETILSLPDNWKCYNTSLTHGPNGYVLAIEMEASPEIVGIPYTVLFAKSQNLRDFEIMDPQRFIYTKDHYSACPTIRFVGDFYYLICLEPLPYYKFVPFLVRSKNLSDWEPAPVNPIFFYDDNDRILARPFTEDQIDLILHSLDTNNSDVDLTEFNGKTILTYSWGNQMGREFLAYAEFPGSMQEFFESFY